MSEKLEELRLRIEQAEAALEALKAEEVEAVVEERGVSLLKLRDVEEKLHRSESRYRELFENMTEGFALHEIVTDRHGKPCDYRFLHVNPAFGRLTGLETARLVGRRVREVMPDIESFWIETYGRVALAGETARFERFSAPLGKWFEVSAYRPAPRQFAVIFADVTNRKRAESSLKSSAMLSDGLNRINEAVHSTRDFDQIMQRVVAEGAQSLGSETAAVVLRVPGGWQVRYTHGPFHEHVDAVMDDEEARHALLAVQTGEPVPVSDAFADERFDRDHMRRYDIRSVLAVPLMAGGRPLGVLLLNYHSGVHEFTDAEMNFARQLASIGSTSLENARLYQETRKAEEDLRTESDKLRAVIDNVSVGIGITDSEGTTLSLNAEALRIHGFKTEKEMFSQLDRYVAEFELREPDGRIIPVDEWPSSKATRGEYVRDYEVVLIRRSTGEERFVSYTAIPIADADGEVKLHVFNMLDLTERKRVERALARQHELLTRIYDHIPVLFVIWDPRLRRFMLNRHAEDVLGWTTADANRGDFMRMVYPDDEYRAEATEYMQLLRPGWREWICRTKDGRQVPIDWANIRLTDDTRIGIGVDLRERKEAEEKIKASLAEKDVLLREIHHRVKNNLQVVSSLVSLRANHVEDPGLRAMFSEVRDRVRAMAMVHEKLYESGGPARLDFAAYAESLTRALWRAHGAGAAGVRLNLRIEPVPLTLSEAVPCGLVLNELASNALKHAFPGGRGVLAVSLTMEPGGSRVTLRVQDDGVGLPVDLDWRDTRTFGLRLVHMLAEQLGGTVELGPAPGADFRVIFPLREPETARVRSIDENKETGGS